LIAAETSMRVYALQVISAGLWSGIVLARRVPGQDFPHESSCSPHCRIYFAKMRFSMKAFLCAAALALTIGLTAGNTIAQQPPAQRDMQNMPGMMMSDSDKQKEASIQANLAKLSPEDRKLAQAQKFCAIQTKNRLGSMGAPVKLTIKGQPVFLCCNMCVAKAQANPDKTLASIAELKQEVEIDTNLATLKPEDRKFAEAQKFCAIETKNRLGAMGAPVKITIKNQPVFLCCEDCVDKAKSNPDKTLASVASLIKANKMEEAKK
jgi:hypothetical protein